MDREQAPHELAATIVLRRVTVMCAGNPVRGYEIHHGTRQNQRLVRPRFRGYRDRFFGGVLYQVVLDPPHRSGGELGVDG
ncbi:hypothetical protein, partial [Nocardia farcinica]|uniref:hypothetical protein n=1 Tax=Nocardia farcinica TaxID=37329 RepID=UPI0024569567